MTRRPVVGSEADITAAMWQKMDSLVLGLSRERRLDEVRLLFLERIGELIPHDRAFFDVGYRRGGESVFGDPLSLNMSDAELTAYYKLFQDFDFTVWLMHSHHTVAYRDSDFITEMGRDGSEIYQRWMKPMGVYYSIGSVLVDNDVLYGSITLFRSRERDFSDVELKILDILSQHLTALFSMRYPNGIIRRKQQKGTISFEDRYRITPREREVIDGILSGHDNEQIARSMFVSVNTVKKHLTHIFKKCDVASRVALVLLYNDVAGGGTASSRG